MKRARTQPLAVRGVQRLLEDLQATESEMKAARSVAQRQKVRLEWEQLRSTLQSMAPQALEWMEWMDERRRAAEQKGHVKRAAACKSWQARFNEYAYGGKAGAGAVA